MAGLPCPEGAARVTSETGIGGGWSTVASSVVTVAGADRHDQVPASALPLDTVRPPPAPGCLTWSFGGWVVLR